MSTGQIVGTRSRARLTRQGQITVPKAIRDALGARPGDDIEFVSLDGALVIEVKLRMSVLDFAGIAAAATGRVPATGPELDDVVERGMAAQAIAREARGRRRPPAKLQPPADPRPPADPGR